jgi:hypothetical protein
MEQTAYITTIYLDGIANVTAWEPGYILIPGDGIHNLTIFVIDSAGNFARDTVLFTVDATAPIISLTNPENITYTSHFFFFFIIKVYAFCSDGLSTKDASDSTFTVKNLIDQPTTTPRKTSFMTLYLFLLPLILFAMRKKNFT